MRSLDQHPGHHREVLATAALVRGGAAVDEVGERAGAGAGGRLVLAPQQELDGVVAGGDVGLAAVEVGGGQHGGVDGGEADGVVDDAGGGVAVDVVDVGLVHGPGVDAGLALVRRIVDGATVEPPRLGGAVRPARRDRRHPGGIERLLGRRRDERVDRAVQLAGRGQRALGAEAGLGGVGVDHRLGLGGEVGAVIAAAGSGAHERGEQERRRNTRHGSMVSMNRKSFSNSFGSRCGPGTTSVFRESLGIS